MLNDEIKKVVIEYKEFCDGSFEPEKAIKYIYDNVVYDYDITDEKEKDELLSYITSTFKDENDFLNQTDVKKYTENFIKEHELLMRELAKGPDEKSDRVIIAGGVEFCDYVLLEKTVDEILAVNGITEPEIISGHAKGTDTLGEEYAEKHGLRCTIFPANWFKYGRAAGPIRNKEMLDYAMKEKPMLIAFWNGTSKGTKNMIEIAKKANVKMIVFNYMTGLYIN